VPRLPRASPTRAATIRSPPAHRVHEIDRAQLAF
jgi:hypothetical protein